MSSFIKAPATCPKCGKSSEFIKWDSINTMLDSEIKNKVKDFSAFEFTCQHCNAKAIVDYSFLYHQMEDSILISHCDSKEYADFMYNMLTGKFAPAFGDFVEKGYIIRIVQSLEDLREKIFIFDDKLDDRIIEIYKLMIFSKLPDDGLFEDRSLLDILYSNDSSPHFDILVDGKFVGSAEFNRDMYDALYDDHKDLFSDINKDDPIIDAKYVYDILLKNAGIDIEDDDDVDE